MKISKPPIRYIDVDDLPALAQGAAILGTGGGGEVNTSLIVATRAVRELGPVPLYRLEDLPDDALLAPVGNIGAPISNEMMPCEGAPAALRDEIEHVMGREISALMLSEIGGANGVDPVGWAARLDLPLVDADLMGRAFPRLFMQSMYIAGRPGNYVVISDIVGNVTSIRATDPEWSERIARAVTVAGGSDALFANWFVTPPEAKGAVIEGVVTRAIEIGNSILTGSDPVSSVVGVLGGVRLIDAKIVDIDRKVSEGWTRGSVVMDGLGDDRGRKVRVEIQNENLIVFEDGKVLASVPDFIIVVDSHTGNAISTESLMYGQRVTVIGAPSDPLWRTNAALKIVGPRGFGYDLDFTPIEEIHSVER